MNTEILVCPSINLKHGSATGTGVKRTPSAASDSRVITGIASVFGNADSVDDVVQKGAFQAAISDFKAGRSRARFLWSHSSTEPPIAKILEIRELSRNELPAEVKSDPSVTGGLLVRREYLRDYYSDRVFRAVKAGAIGEMSFAFTVDDFEYADQKGKKVRLVKSVSLFDISDVTFGANSATLGVMKTATILTMEKVNQLKARRLEEIGRKEKLEELKYYMKHLPRKPLTQQQWVNQMKLNQMKLDLIKLSLPT